MKIKLKHALAHKGKIKFPGEIVDLDYSKEICLSHGEEVNPKPSNEEEVKPKPANEEEVKPKTPKRNKPTDDSGNIP